MAKDAREERAQRKWQAPTDGTLKCNVGVQWFKQKRILGSAWIVRNHRGDTLIHSRRAFANIGSFVEAKFYAWLWAIESMHSHHIGSVLFEMEFGDLWGGCH